MLQISDIWLFDVTIDFCGLKPKFFSSASCILCCSEFFIPFFVFFFLLPGFKPLLLFGAFLTASALVSPSPHLLLQLMSLACELSLTSASKVKLSLEPRPSSTVRLCHTHLCLWFPLALCMHIWMCHALPS